MLLHVRDIRLFNNAGVRVPVCEAGRRLLRVSRAKFAASFAEVTCPRCRTRAPRAYPWASFR